MKRFTAAALAADKLSLGSHWIYDQAELAATFPDGVLTATDPLSPYHPNRKAGQHTHIGDQLVLLSQSITEQGSYDPDHWRNTWLAAMGNYDGYVDGATKATLATKAQNPSGSNEFSVVSRIAPILDLKLEVEEAAAQAQSQAALTHGGDLIPEVVEFFVRVICRVSEGATIEGALSTEAATERYPHLNAASALTQAKAADPTDFRQVAQDFGQACSLDAAFPLTLYFALHHAGSLATCLSKNALAGGDNTARAMVLAMMLSEAHDA